MKEKILSFNDLDDMLTEDDYDDYDEYNNVDEMEEMEYDEEEY